MPERNLGLTLTSFLLLTFDLLMQNDFLKPLLDCCLLGQAMVIHNAVQHKEPRGAHFILFLFCFFHSYTQRSIYTYMNLLVLTQLYISIIYFWKFLNQVGIFSTAMSDCTGCALHNPGAAIYRCNHSPGLGGLTPVWGLCPAPLLDGLTLQPRPCIPFFFSSSLLLQMFTSGLRLPPLQGPIYLLKLGLLAWSSKYLWFPRLRTKPSGLSHPSPSIPRPF